MDEVIKNTSYDEVARMVKNHPLWKAGDVDENDLKEVTKLLMEDTNVEGYIDDVLGDYFYDLANNDDATYEAISNITNEDWCYDCRAKIASDTVERMWKGQAYDVALCYACEDVSEQIADELAESRAYQEELQALSREMDREIYRGLQAERRAYR